jgi:RNA polymerase sigma factor (sigma-70 family)
MKEFFPLVPLFWKEERSSGSNATMKGSLGSILGHLRRVVVRRCDGGLSDAQLLQRFATNRDEAAFEVLVWRHGPMVLGVGRRVLRNLSDAEDVLQATFLALVRQAPSISRGGALASWLYRVAYRIALRAREQREKRPVGQVPVEEVPAPQPPEEDFGQDVLPVLDEELQRLPEKYRIPLVLSYLQGLTNREVAELMGRPIGTVFTRLYRGRELLRKRLIRRGVVVPVGALSMALAERATAAPLSEGLVRGLVKTALMFAAGSGTAAGALSPNVAVLTEGVLKMLWLSRLRFICATLMVLALAGTGAGLWAFRGTAPEQENAPKNAREAVKSAEGTRPPAKEMLRYGGKSFDDWRTVLMTDLKPETRAEAIKAMSAFGANGYGREATVAIVEAMRGYDLTWDDQETHVVLDAGQRGLGKIGAEALPVLVDELKKGEKNSRRFVLYALPGFYGGAKAAVPAVREALKDVDPDVRNWAITALLSIDDGTSVTALADLMKDNDVSVRFHALEALSQFGPKAKAATPKLLEAVVKDAAPRCRRQALAALKFVKPDAKTVVPTLREALRDEDPDLRLNAISFLGELGPEAKEAVPDLIAALKKVKDDKDRSERLRIIDVLGNMGPAAKEAIPVLTEMMSRIGSNDPHTRNRAVDALAKISK